MQGWVDVGYPAMHRPGVELATSQLQVWRLNHYTTEPPCVTVCVTVFIREDCEDGLHREFEIITQSVDVWHVSEYSRHRIDPADHGQFHNEDAYVVCWRYAIAQSEFQLTLIQLPILLLIPSIINMCTNYMFMPLPHFAVVGVIVFVPFICLCFGSTSSAYRTSLTWYPERH